MLARHRTASTRQPRFTTVNSVAGYRGACNGTTTATPTTTTTAGNKSILKVATSDKEVVVSTRTGSISPTKRKAQDDLLSESAVPTTPVVSRDYHVLQLDLESRRSSVLDSRAALASSLDRLGEHHVRQKEYDEAMDAFSEALQEKRSILSCLFPKTSIYANSIADSLGRHGMSATTSKEQNDCIEEVIRTLRNMGNVHSLRGEQDEAMRYYSEVTNLRATKSSALADADESSTLFSGCNQEEDTSTLMSGINEDVKALDDMFRSISFRNQESLATSRRQSSKESPLELAKANSITASSKRRKAEITSRNFSSFESEPFQRSSSLNLVSAESQTSVALDAFRTVLESYQGSNIDKHHEILNSLTLRVDLISDTNKAGERGGLKDELLLAVEIYQHVLQVQKEIISDDQSDDDNVNNSHRLSSANMASTLIRMGSLYYRVGDRLQELRVYTEAKNIYKNAFGEEHNFVAGTRKNIGMVLAELGEYDEAIEQFEKARRIYLTVQGGNETCRDVASAIACKGNVKNRIGELDEALEQYVHALNIYKSILEKAEPSDETAILDVTSTLKVIGMVHSKRGDLNAAMGFFAEALSLVKSSTIENKSLRNEACASILTRMGGIHVKKGELEKAMELYKDAYETTVRCRGTTSHQEVASILHYIGGIFHKKAEYDEAMSCYQEAIRIYHSALGPGNSAVAGTLVMVGSIHYKRRNLDSAMMFYREALRLNRDTYGLHHPDVAPILKSIGTILTKKGEYREAYDVFRDVLSIKCTIHGTGDPEVASAYKSLGNVHYKLGELADAERQYRHALNIYRRTKGDSHPDTVSAKTTIDHIRYWMRERGQEKIESRHARASDREKDDDERSC